MVPRIGGRKRIGQHPKIRAGLVISPNRKSVVHAKIIVMQKQLLTSTTATLANLDYCGNSSIRRQGLYIHPNRVRICVIHYISGWKTYVTVCTSAEPVGRI